MKSKILVFLFGMIMVITSLFAVQLCVSASEDNKILINDTFEDISDEYIVEGVELGDVDGWNVTCEDGNSATVVYENGTDGNKVLKFEVAATTTEWNDINAYRNFTRVDADLIEVSYRVKFVRNGQVLQNGPTIYGYEHSTEGETTGNVIATEAFVSSDKYYSRDSNDQYNVRELFAVGDDSKWYSVKFIIDTVNEKFDLYLDGVQRVTKSSFIGDKTGPFTIDGLESLYFRPTARASREGRGESVYLFDDIKVEILTGDEVEDFEGMAVGYVPGSADSDWVLSGNFNEGDSITVEIEDQLTENKALKMVKSAERSGGENADYTYSAKKNIIRAESERILVSYKMRVEKYGQYLEDGPSLYGYKYLNEGVKETPKNLIPTLTSADSGGVHKYYNVKTPSAEQWDLLQVITFEDPNKWYTIKYIINTVANTFDLYLDGEEKIRDAKFVDNALVDGLDSLLFKFRTIVKEDDESTICWYDDIRVQSLPLETTFSKSRYTGTITSLEDQSSVYAKIPVWTYAKENEETEATAIIALYDDKNMLQSLNFEPITISEYTTSCSVGLTGIESQPGWKIRAFLWNNLDELKPFKDTIGFIEHPSS